MRTLKGLRLLHLLATTYSQRPSALVGETDPARAFQIDHAVLMAGLNRDPEKKDTALQG